MYLKNKIIFITLLLTLTSCKYNSVSIKRNSYEIDLKAAEYFHDDYTNSIQASPLKIQAERMTLQELFGILLKTDTSNVTFDNQELKSKNFQVLIKQKVNKIQVNEKIANEITTALQLKLIKNKYPFFAVAIKDRLKYNRFINTSKDNVAAVAISADSIEVTNADLFKLVEVINNEYSEKINCNFAAERINYKWKKTNFYKLKVQLEQDLGLVFVNQNKDRIRYSITSH